MHVSPDEIQAFFKWTLQFCAYRDYLEREIIYIKLKYDQSWPRMVIVRSENNQSWPRKVMLQKEQALCRPSEYSIESWHTQSWP